MLPIRAASLISLVCSLGTLVTSPAFATSTQAWVMRSKADFADARLEGVTISPEGRIALSPQVERLAESPQPVLWCIAVDAKGVVYVGGGNEGQVFRAGASGMEVAFDAPEVEVHAIAIDTAGRLYVGTSPDGRVYRVSGGKPGDAFFSPEAKYIWALIFDDAGNLLVATGQPGRVYRVSSSGKGEVVLEGREDHIRTLVGDGKGGFYAGSDQGGVIYHVSSDGKESVLYDTPAREIPALVMMDGDVYAAALTPMQRGRPAPEVRGSVTRVRVTPEGGGDAPDDAESQIDAAQNQPRPQPAESYSGAIYRISTQGYARKIWESRDATPLSLLPLPGGRLLVGTGDRGRLFAISAGGDASELSALEASQVNALAALPDGSTLAATSNLGALFKLSRSYSKEGSITSGPRDSGLISRWGALSWDAETPPGTQLAIDVRTGNTEEPDGTWSEWSKAYTDSRSALIDRPDARYLQWRAKLRSSGDATPLLKAVQVHYLPRNMPPEIDSVEIQNPGVSLQPSGAPQGGGDEGGESSPRRASPPKRSFQRGIRSVTWKATDANSDPLRTEVQYRAEDETAWKTIQSGVEEDFLAWDSTAMPDGVYRIRIIVSDAAANPTGKGYTGQRESAPFDVDNTPPAVTDVTARMTGKLVEVRATVTDSFSVIGETSYSVDAADWTVVLPEDGIADSTRESYRFSLASLAPGEHSVVVRARDRAGNVSAGKAVVTIP